MKLSYACEDVIFARKHILVYQCETVRKHQQGRARIFFLILCSKSWRVYEAIFCLSQLVFLAIEGHH